MMSWAMADESFKVRLFRFVDVFPTLSSSQQVHAHLLGYLAAPGINVPNALELGIRIGSLFKGDLRRAVEVQIDSIARRFIAGEDADDALERLRSRWQQGIGFSVDLLGEACVSDIEARTFQASYVRLIERLAGRLRGRGLTAGAAGRAGSGTQRRSFRRRRHGTSGLAVGSGRR
jgi:RHH-type proline utilization regulon transcriptional repressor/proline dehydrogenase/delta 1-pyrroline-5-carboxylate dehydrogenase